MNIHELRALALQRHKAATRKVSRLRSKGVEIGGSEFDVRRNPANIKRYTTSQLNSYIGKLNSFTARDNGFVASAGGPIQSSLVKRFRAAEREENRRAQQESKRYGNIPVMNTGMTIAERDATVRRPGGKRTYGDVTTRVFEEKTMNISNVYGPEALKKLIAATESRLVKDYKPRKLKEQRSQAIAMANSFGDPEMIKQIEDLTDNQFNIWFNHTREASNLKRGYIKQGLINSSRGNDADRKMLDDSHADLRESLQWAEFLPTGRAARGTRTKKK